MICRWEKPDPAQSHWLYVDAEDLVVAEVWRDGLVWRVDLRNGSPERMLAWHSQRFFTAEAAQAAMEKVLA